MSDDRKIIIDNGSGRTKAGFAGDDSPCSVFPSIVGRPRDKNQILMKKLNECYVGDYANAKRGLLFLNSPIEKGIITNWEDMEQLWHHTFYNELDIVPQDHSVLLSESALNPTANREKTTQIMFETFQVPALYLAKQAVLSLYANGNTSGVSVDLGNGSTNIVPITEGNVIPSAVSSVDIGGKDLTEYLMKLLNERGWGLVTMAEREIVRDVKEKHSFVSLDFDSDMEKAATSNEYDREYELPDGQVLTLGNERFRCPELLFQPLLANDPEKKTGIHEAIWNTIMKCGIQYKSDFCQNIILSGGSSMFPGLDERIKKEVAKLAPHGLPIGVIAPSHRLYSPWIGGSILGSLSTFQKMWITKGEYDEVGSCIVTRKFF